MKILRATLTTPRNLGPYGLGAGVTVIEEPDMFVKEGCLVVPGKVAIPLHQVSTLVPAPPPAPKPKAVDGPAPVPAARAAGRKDKEA